ncbi:AfsR/SARP family transcriptional regulator [Kitasatospora acidiphila]|uniref:AfsR/SARP family transcriptional regulator n=1 Tax=Kitasatospora acidiphila TaxID=2567942 RepID=UPI0015F02E76|nr:BTAD domain-containing putative transcriptional regulator [Kitasatospora acidiphila]
MVELRLLGTVDMVVAGNRSKLGPEKLRCLLAALAVDIGRPLSLDTLADRLWADQLPTDPAASLYPLISKLRRALRTGSETEGPATPTVSIGSHGHAYVLESDPHQVDYHRFRRLANQARAYADQGEDEQAIALMTAAEALWQGDPLAGLRGEWAQGARADMHATHLWAAITRATISLRLGRFSDVIPELSPLAALHDTDQVLTARLMAAMYGAGRQSEALALYQRARRTLQERLGTDPGRELTWLHERILAGVPVSELLPRPPVGRTPVAPPVGPTPVAPPGGAPAAPRTSDSIVAAPIWLAAPNNLPTLRPLVGREQELERATDPALTGPRVISGLGGTGKTSLAVHAAVQLRSRYPDGQILVALHAHSATQRTLTPQAVLIALLRAFELPPRSIPTEHEKRIGLWHQLLADRQCVVVLDDVAGADQVRELLPMACRSLILLTSRRGLHELPSAHHIVLDALPVSQATELFRSLVGPERANDPAQIEEIVHCCLRHPYAVELVATRFKTRSSWTLEHLLQRLRHSTRLLDELHDTGRDLAPILELSYRSLSAEHQESFRLLSLYPGTRFDQFAATALLGRSLTATERALEELIETHLLQEPVPENYAFHDLMAEFAAGLEHRTDPGATEQAALSRLIRFTIDAVDRADRMLYPHRLRLDIPPELTATAWARSWQEPAAVRDWLSSRLSELLSVLRHAADSSRGLVPSASGETAVPAGREAAWLTHALGGFLDAEGFWAEAITLHSEAAEYWHTVGDGRAETRALLDLVAVHGHLAQFPQAVAVNPRALATARQAGDLEGIAEATSQAGVLNGKAGDFQAALKSQQAALAISLSYGNSRQADRIRNNMGIIMIYLGDHESAIALLEESLVGFRQIGNTRLEVTALSNLGHLLVEKGEMASARAVLERCLTIGAPIMPAHELAGAQMNLIAALDLPADWERAHHLASTALDVFRRAGDRWAQLESLIIIGDLLRRAGRHREAISWYQEALPLGTALGADHGCAMAARGLGTAEAAVGQLEGARLHLTAAVEVLHRLRHQHEEAEALQALADLLTRLGEHGEAARARSSAKAILQG